MEVGALLTGVVRPGAFAGRRELLAPLDVAPVAGAIAAGSVVLVDGLAGVAVPTALSPTVVPWPGLPWTTADS